MEDVKSEQLELIAVTKKTRSYEVFSAGKLPTMKTSRETGLSRGVLAYWYKVYCVDMGIKPIRLRSKRVKLSLFARVKRWLGR